MISSNTPVSEPNLSCNIPENWAIRYSRSGGFAGFNESLTLDSHGRLHIQSERLSTNVEKTITEEQINQIANLLVQACPFVVHQTDARCADCFIYELVIQMGTEKFTVVATDTTLSDEMHPLINMLNGLLQD